MKKVKLPKKINVMGRSIKIRVVELNPDTDGRYVPTEKTIYIRKDQPDGDVINTLVHELFHVVIERVGLYDDLGIAIEHVLVNSFANFITENFDIKIKDKPGD